MGQNAYAATDCDEDAAKSSKMILGIGRGAVLDNWLVRGRCAHLGSLLTICRPACKVFAGVPDKPSSEEQAICGGSGNSPCDSCTAMATPASVRVSLDASGKDAANAISTTPATVASANEAASENANKTPAGGQPLWDLPYMLHTLCPKLGEASCLPRIEDSVRTSHPGSKS